MRFFRFVKNPKRINVFLKDSDKKNILLVLKEFIALTFVKKEIPYYYFKHIYKKEVKNIYDYLSTGERNRIHADREMNKIELTSIMQNKLSFAIFCEALGVKSPKVLVHNFSSRFYYQQEVLKTQSTNDLIEFFVQILKKENITELFAKPLSLLGGKGCFKLTADNLEETLIERVEHLSKGSYIFTKVIRQHPEINKIHGNSINTIRFLSFSENGEIELLSSAMRFGIGQSVVDNSSSGGFYVPIDLHNGTLEAKGWTSDNFGGNKVTHHPNSNYELKGFKIPFYQEAMDMILQYTKYIPNKLVGWDVAITPTGPTVIEANHDPYLGISDVAIGGLLKNLKFKSFMVDVNKRAKQR